MRRGGVAMGSRGSPSGWGFLNDLLMPSLNRAIPTGRERREREGERGGEVYTQDTERRAHTLTCQRERWRCHTRQL